MTGTVLSAPAPQHPVEHILVEPERVCGRASRGSWSSAIRKSSSDPVSFRRRFLRDLQGGSCLRGAQVRGLRRTPQNGLSLQRARCRSPIPEVDDGQRASRDRTLAPSAQGGPERGSAPGSAEPLRRAAAPSTVGVPAPQASAVTRGLTGAVIMLFAAATPDSRSPAAPPCKSSPASRIAAGAYDRLLGLRI